MAAITQKAKITLTDFNPKQIAAQPDTVKRLLLGYLVARAVGVTTRSAPDGGDQKFTGLRGDFEAHFVVPDINGNVPDPWQSGVLFIPDAFQDKLVALLTDTVDADGKVVTRGADAVGVTLEISIQRAANQAGYEWLLTPVNEVAAETQQDRLAELRRFIPSGVIKNAPALTDQSGTGQSANEQEKAPAKGRK